MAAKKFKSKIDNWIRILLLVVIVVQVLAIGTAATSAPDPLVTTGMTLLAIAVVGLMIWLLLGTHYTVDRGVVRIVSGPFRRTIQIEQITSVENSRNPLSSPALSLDRLLIRYGKNRRIMISPADKAGFLKAIGHGRDE